MLEEEDLQLREQSVGEEEREAMRREWRGHLSRKGQEREAVRE